jgi:Flp pilus assembly protein TadD
MKHARKIKHDTSKVYKQYEAPEKEAVAEVKVDEAEAEEDEEDDEDSGESNVDVPNPEATEAVQQAIVKAEADDLVGALNLFEHAFKLSPETGSFAMNLAVTQMRVGLLGPAALNFKKAEKLLGGVSEQLKGNLKALKDHVKFAKSINHDTSKMYPKYDAETTTGSDAKAAEVDEVAEEEAEEDDDDDEDDAEGDDSAAVDASAEATKEAIAKAEAGNLVGAITLFERAFKLKPDNSNYCQNLAVTQMRVGLIDSARKNMNKAKELLGEVSAQLKGNMQALKVSSHVDSIMSNKTVPHAFFKNE